MTTLLQAEQLSKATVNRVLNDQETLYRTHCTIMASSIHTWLLVARGRAGALHRRADGQPHYAAAGRRRRPSQHRSSQHRFYVLAAAIWQQAGCSTRAPLRRLGAAGLSLSSLAVGAGRRFVSDRHQAACVH